MSVLRDLLAKAQHRPPVPIPLPEPGNGLMDRMVERALSRKIPERLSDIRRICNLPIARPLTDQELEAVNQMHVKAEARKAGFSLMRTQAEALQCFVEHEALFGAIEVGGGKTLISLRCAGIAHERGVQRMLLVVPAQVYTQLMSHDISWVRARTSLGFSIHGLGGMTFQQRQATCQRRAGLWVMPYSLLSVQDTSAMLDKIRPELLILDEAHALKNKSSARTKRILALWRKLHPEIVALSGTMTSKSLKDYAHLLQMCLGEGSPLPLEAQVVDSWAATLDSDQAQQAWHNRTTSTGPLRPLIVWSNRNFPQQQVDYDVPGFRRAYLNRLITTPGVVSSPADALGASLTFQNTKVDPTQRPGSEQMRRLIKQVEDLWVTPSGDEIEWAIHKFQWLYQLSSGFYSDLRWPHPQAVATKLGIPLEDAKDRLKRSTEHHRLLQEYHRELRRWLSEHHRIGLDTPKLVGLNMHKNGPDDVGPTLYRYWKKAKDAEFDGLLERESIPVRVCDYKVQAAVDWMKERPEGIVWWYHQEMGRWVTEAAVAAGLPAVFCHAGKDIDEFLTGAGAAERCRGKFLICSIAAHSTGKNLQFMSEQLFVQLPLPEERAQQAVGRVHRRGQMADEVAVQMLVSNSIDETTLATILNDAVYVTETTGSQRKVLVGTWNPMPVVYGSRLLQRAGTQAKLLNAKQQMMLVERFGELAAD